MTEKRIALAINGRFLAQPISGVQRYGRELIQALDGVLLRAKRCAFSSVTVWVPPSLPADALPSGLKILKSSEPAVSRVICGSSGTPPSRAQCGSH